MRYELTDHQWATIKPMLPNKPRGVPRVNDRRFPERHLLGPTVRRTVTRSAAELRSLHHLLQPQRAVELRCHSEHGRLGFAQCGDLQVQ
jgi:transposase